MSTRSRSLVPVLVLVSAVLAVVALFPALAAGKPTPSPGAASSQPLLTRGERAAQVALHEVGTPYVWGGESPHGFDCSGLVRYAYMRVGISLPHSSYAMSATGRRVGRSQLEPGDLLFYEGLGHVGIYVGNGRMVHAPQSGRSVEVVSLSGGYGSSFVTARRVVRG